MGNMSTEEKIGISILAIIFAPFILVGRALKSIGQSLGLVREETYEYDPTLDPNSPEYKE